MKPPRQFLFSVIIASISLPIPTYSSIIPSQETLQSTSQNILPSVPRFPNTLGIGFELSMTYATAALFLANGTTLPITTIFAGAQYIKAMDEYADKQRRFFAHNCPLCDDDELAALRPGHSASLSRMLRALKRDVEEWLSDEALGGEVKAATACAPYLETLWRDDMLDAFAMVGMEYLYEPETSSTRDMVYSSSAVFAGNGMGLCADYIEVETCREEERNMRPKHMVHIHYTSRWLLVSDPSITHAYNLSESSERWPMEWKLGSDARSTRRRDVYWSELNTLLRLKGFENHDGGFRDVLLSGESASYPEFRAVLEELMRDLFPDEKHLPKVDGDDALYVAAKGAAEIAKRALWKRRR
ncbi:hypothetical protein NA57DRAFT_62387 [Rhizodiscina lignyota]|uniref:Uncharacterized protein n=1 Tax=Rhizodiscina lignyota TaxID=1504668 RepID=A0A9P4M2P9_9PEZI|nr:hypothetical protein NA57DRAFT_62387 [Rhizodiscina lignyota]